MQVRADRWFLEAFLIMPVRVPVADYRVSVHIKPWEEFLSLEAMPETWKMKKKT